MVVVFFNDSTNQRSLSGHLKNGRENLTRSFAPSPLWLNRPGAQSEEGFLAGDDMRIAMLPENVCAIDRINSALS